ncbi:MAG: Ig-like domain-containing protein [Planctomycetia bacterium]|nr:Ig-like domain-containing protein [Planctomycetia bacterium]
MLRLSDIYRKLFRRCRKKTTPLPTRARLTLTALEDRTTPTPVVTITGSASVVEGNSTLLQVTRTETSGFLSVNFSTSGTAGYFSDYSINSSPIMFAPGVPTAYITVGSTNDGTSEPTETVIVTLASGSGYTIGSPDSATVNILDDDAQVVTVAQVNDAVEDGTDGVFRFTRTGDLSGSLTVNFSVGGTATSGTDYTSLGTSVNFSASSATADKTVVAVHDSVDDPDEMVTVTVTSGTGYSIGSPSSAEVTIIDVEDSLPVAFDGSTTTSVNDPVVVEVLDFASDLDGDELTVTAVTQGEYGSVIINQDGTVTYTPETDFFGDDSFTYTVEDTFESESTGTISVTVVAPIAPPTSVWTAENTPVTIEVLELAFDPDEDELTVTGVTQGSNGSVIVNVDGTITYTPNTSFTGDDSFTYTVEDEDENEATHTITVTVGDIDPVALDDEATTPVNTPLEITISDVAFDPAGDELTVVSVTQGTYGTVTINQDGTITYTPNTSFEGTDSFTYTVEDEDENEATGTITVTVGAEPASPVSAIVEDLSDLEDEIDNYDEDTPETILAALPDLMDAIDDYLDDVTTLISANSIDVWGANQPFKDFTETGWGIYKVIYPAYVTLLEAEAALWSFLVANKNLVDALTALIAAERAAPQPNVALLTQMVSARQVLAGVQRDTIAKWSEVIEKAFKPGYIEALKTWKAWVNQTKPPAIVAAAVVPPQFPFIGADDRKLEDIVPKPLPNP